MWLTDPTSIHENADSIPGLTQWVQDLRCCCELWCRSQTRLGSRIAVAVVEASSCSSDSTPSLETSICCGYSCKKKKKKKCLQLENNFSDKIPAWVWEASCIPHYVGSPLTYPVEPHSPVVCSTHLAPEPLHRTLPRAALTAQLWESTSALAPGPGSRPLRVSS